MTLAEWGLRHNVSPAAMAELIPIVLSVAPDVQPERNDLGTSEAAVQARTRVAVSKLGWRVWRNNVGAGTLQESGTFVRFGLANDSQAVNQSLKSGDLIGIRPGGQFVSLECKPAGWKYTGTPREVAQAKWAALVRSLGGHARFVTDERDVL